MHKWFQNHTIKARFYKIIFHSPSFEIKNLEKSPIKKSKIGLDNSSLEKNIKGSLLIIYYQKINEVRTVFKITTAKKLHYHLFDFNAFEKMEETLKVKIMREFFKEILKSFCIYYDDLLMISKTTYFKLIFLYQFFF